MADPKFNVGEIVRYAAGSTALMRISHVSPHHGVMHRYYGDSFHGSPMGVYEPECRAASEHEQKKWRQAHEREDKPNG